MEYLGAASLVFSIISFVLSYFISGYRDFKKETRSKIEALEKSTGNACELRHLDLKEDILNIVQGNSL